MIALAAALLGLVAAYPLPSGAQTDYPTHAVKIIVPFPPGGGNDITARLLAQRFQEELKQPFVVENRPGADGSLAFDAVKRSAPDGYTLLLGQSTGMTINPAVYAKLPYDPLTDFAPISTVGMFPLVLVVNAQTDIRDISQFLARAKSAPPLAIGHPTISYRVAMSMLAKETGFSFTSVPYRGSGPTLNGLLTREIDAALIDLAAVKSQIESGALRALAVASASRTEFLPGVPTLQEAGVKGFDVEFWSGLFAPAGTPNSVIDRLRTIIVQFLATDELKSRAASIAMKPLATTPVQLRAMIEDQIRKYKKVATEEKISIE
jgi:tripartite-type tricarboxylate transporter receptor subunit TctC